MENFSYALNGILSNLVLNLLLYTSFLSFLTSFTLRYFFLLTILRELKNESKIHVLNRIFIVSMSMFGGSKKNVLPFYAVFYSLLEHKLSSDIQLLSVCMEMIKNLDAFNFKLLQLVGAI